MNEEIKDFIANFIVANSTPENMKIPDFVEEYNGKWLLKNDQSISVMVKQHGSLGYDRDFINLPELNAMPIGSLFIDVGAFIGDITRIALDKGLCAIAFEPQHDAFECLKHNCPESRNYNFPLGDGRKVKLYESGGGNMGGRPVVEGGDIHTQKLDDFIPQNASHIFLKLDAEGFEPAILAGATNLINNPALKYIVCEFNPNAMKAFGYDHEDVLKYIPNWKYREMFRYGYENWDCVFERR
jgi:FkbM family methyltransferase